MGEVVVEVGWVVVVTALVAEVVMAVMAVGVTASLVPAADRC